MKLWIVAAVVVFVGAMRGAEACGQSKPELWLYYSTNLLVDENIDSLEKIWGRASAAGYTKVMLADSKFGRLAALGANQKHYMANVARVNTIAARLKIGIVPCVFGIGYSNDLLGRDPNLAEGLPVRDVPFVVNQGVAALEADRGASLKLKPSFKDNNISIDGEGVATVANQASNARLSWELTLPPFRCYHVTAWIRTEDYTGKPEIKAIADTKRELQYQNLSVKKSQDWTQYDVVFNTLDSHKVNVYLGAWGSAKGKLQWKQWKIEEAGPVNILRRPGTPLVVKNAETGKLYAEGKDFEKVIDPKMGMIPWPGEYRAWHETPAIKTNLPDGTKLLVSWYHPAIIYDGQVSMCFAEPEAMGFLADQARSVKAAFNPAGFMMSHDELRTLGWDEACDKDGPDKPLNAGKLLADNARACTKLLAGSEVYVWSDMFDPLHNAHDNYYLVHGDLAGSWEGLDKSVIVVNWNFEHRDESLKFFADRGHRQLIAGYYDGDAKQVTPWLESAAKVKGVVGVMYTTWEGKYGDLEAFAKVVRGAP